MDIIQYASEVLHKKLTKEQIELINSTEINTAGLAVPGSGKTSVFTLRVGKLMFEKNVHPDNMLLLTFSKAAANEMNNYFVKWFPIETLGYTKAPEFRTIHSFAYMLLARFDRNFKKENLIEGKEVKITKEEIIRRIHQKIEDTYLSEEEIKDILGKIGYFKNKMVEPNYVNDKEISINHFKTYYKDYELFKRANDLYDFDDILNVAYKILCKYPEVVAKLQEKYKYIQIDEYQDTSSIQNAIVMKIFNPETMNLFVVGDDDQSIYKFRGVDPKEFLNFTNNVPNSQIMFLSTNFRSTENIINSAIKFVSQNKIRQPKNMVPYHPMGKNIHVECFENSAEQEDFVLQNIKETDTDKKIAILYRNNVSAIPYILKFIQNDISFSCAEIDGFLSVKAINDVVNIMKFYYDQTNFELFKRISKVFYLPKSIVAGGDYQEGENILENILCSFSEGRFRREDSKYEGKICEIVKHLNNLQYKNSLEAIEYICNEMGYSKYLKKANPEDALTTANSLFDLNILKSIAENVPDKQEFLKEVYFLNNKIKDLKPNKKAQIQLRTIHSSKGLEWDKVFIVDMVKDIFPTITSIKNIVENNDYEEYEEERRLFYVGMTRAKKELYILSPVVETDDKKADSPSIFIQEFEDVVRYGDSDALDNFVNLKKGRKKKSKTDKNQTTLLAGNFGVITSTYSGTINNIINQSSNGFEPKIDMEINHKTLGKGKIINVSPDKKTVQIKFDKFPIPKNMVVSILVKNLIN